MLEDIPVHFIKNYFTLILKDVIEVTNKLLKIIIIFLSIILFKYSSFATFLALLLSGTSLIVYTKYTNYSTLFGFILTIILDFYFIFSLIRNLFKKIKLLIYYLLH